MEPRRTDAPEADIPPPPAGILPISTWLPKYQLPDFRGDLLAGLTVAAVLIPQGMSYSVLAGLPPIYGLFAGLMPMFSYSTSKELSVGPAAMVSLTIPSAIEALAGASDSDSHQEQYAALSVALAFVTGLVVLIAAAFNVGFYLEQFLSLTVLSGFTQGAAVLICVSQAKHLLAISIPPDADSAQEVIIGLWHGRAAFNYVALIIGLTVIGIITGLKRVNPRIPGPLIALLFATGVAWVTGLSEDAHPNSVKVLGHLPRMLPSLSKPDVNADRIYALLLPATIIGLLGFLELISVAKKFASKGHYAVSSNQELTAMGFANLLGSFFSSFPVGASLARTAVNHQIGSRTPLCNLLCSFFVGLALLLLTALFYHTPYACLGAIVITAASHLIEPDEVRRMWRNDERGEVALFMFAFCATVLGSPTYGVVASILLSLVDAFAKRRYARAAPPVTYSNA